MAFQNPSISDCKTCSHLQKCGKPIVRVDHVLNGKPWVFRIFQYVYTFAKVITTMLFATHQRSDYHQVAVAKKGITANGLPPRLEPGQTNLWWAGKELRSQRLDVDLLMALPDHDVFVRVSRSKSLAEPCIPPIYSSTSFSKALQIDLAGYLISLVS